MVKKNSSIVAVIPARAGSKGLIGKNLRQLLGHPLIAYPIAACHHAHLVDRIIVSTEDQEIAETARRYGADVPFLRPHHLATDNASSESVLQHCLQWLEQNEDCHPEIVVFLQATDIFRKKGMINACVERLINDSELESAFVAQPTHKKFWQGGEHNFFRLNSAAYTPRQLAEPLFREDCGLACATRATLIRQGKRLGDRVWIYANNDPFAAIDIHDKIDLWLAETVMKKLLEEGAEDYCFSELAGTKP